jgi:hypothetical protein
VEEIARRGMRPLLGGRKSKGWMSEDSHAAIVAGLQYKDGGKKLLPAPI